MTVYWKNLCCCLKIYVYLVVSHIKNRASLVVFYFSFFHIIRTEDHKSPNELSWRVSTYKQLVIDNLRYHGAVLRRPLLTVRYFWSSLFDATWNEPYRGINRVAPIIWSPLNERLRSIVKEYGFAFSRCH